MDLRFWKRRKAKPAETEKVETSEKASIEQAEQAETPPEPQSDPAAEEPAGGWLGRFKRSLTLTRERLGKNLGRLSMFGRKVDEEALDELLEALIEADIGFKASEEICDNVRRRARKREDDDLGRLLRAALEELLTSVEELTLSVPEEKPLVILLVGVNGTGKTTTIGKLAQRFRQAGHSVTVVAADTFRAAAIEQLGVWADRSGADFVSSREGADPSSVVFDGVASAIAKEKNIVLVDTAGRLQSKVNLMEELKKVRRVIGKHGEDIPVISLLTVDATTGQNGLSQVEKFGEAVKLDGIILSKLDGSAKGGIIFPIYQLFKVPVVFVGTGEKIGDLDPFVPSEFVEGIFSD